MLFGIATASELAWFCCAGAKPEVPVQASEPKNKHMVRSAIVAFCFRHTTGSFNGLSLSQRHSLHDVQLTRKIYRFGFSSLQSSSLLLYDLK